MRNINILNKEGFLTKEDRKKSLEHGGNYFNFKTNLELSEPIVVTPYGYDGENSRKMSIDKYSEDLMAFSVFWNNFVSKDLNGFSGFSHIKFKFVGFTLK